jgi:hypothetical protein
LPLAGRIVDLHREKRGTAVVETAIEPRVEMRVGAHPFAHSDAGAAGHRDDVGYAAGRRLLLAGDLIDAGVTIGRVNG